MSAATAPSHGRGSAAEQGARIRAQMAQRQSMSHQQQRGESDSAARRSGSNKRSSRQRVSVDQTGWGRTEEEAARDEKHKEEERKRRREARRRSEKEGAAAAEKEQGRKDAEARKAAVVEEELDEIEGNEDEQDDNGEATREIEEGDENMSEPQPEKPSTSSEVAADDEEGITKTSAGDITTGERKEVAKDPKTAAAVSKTSKKSKAAKQKDQSKAGGKAASAKPKRRSNAAKGAAAGAAAGAVAEKKLGRDRPPPKFLKRGRCFPMDGIDNLALMMEGDAYQTTCFSMYLFKTELDSETISKFFNKLVECYPKFHYVAELSPSQASSKEKAFKAGKDAPRVNEVDLHKGRRTRYSKTLKAGGFFRPAVWRYSDDFCVEDNVTEIDGGCPQGTDEAALFKLAGDFLSEHFDYSKPLWQAFCVRGIRTAEGARSALMIKVHHALSDGQGMIMSYHTALASLEEDAPIEAVQDHVDMRTRKGEQKKPGQRNIRPTLWGTTKHGFHTLRGLYFRSRKAFEYGPVKSSDIDDEGRTGNNRASRRFYCHSKGIPMSDIKLIRNAFSDGGLNLSLNDVACGVLSRALRVAAERTESRRVRDKRVAIFVPISRRPPGNWEMANFTTGAIAWFAFNDPAKVPYKEQLAQVNREMNRIKRSNWPAIWFKLFGAVSKRRSMFLPNYPVGKQFFERTYREYHVATNLPGPAKPVRFGEHEAFSYHVLPPSSPGKSSLSIGMISYADDFSLAVSCDGVREFADRRLAETICAAFQDAAAELVKAALEEQKRVSGSRTKITNDTKEKRTTGAAATGTTRRRAFGKKKADNSEQAKAVESNNEKAS